MPWLPPPPRILIVDLNNFARYPTVGVGYLTSALRERGLSVELFSPLASGVEGVTREPRLRPWSLLDERLRYRTAVAQNRLVRSIRSYLAERRRPSTGQNARRLMEALEERLARPPRVILISAYLMYFDLCQQICRIARERGIPIILGGAYFNEPSVADAWRAIPGLSAIVGGEAEFIIGDLVESLLADSSIEGIPGVWTPKAPPPPVLPPLKNLDSLAFPDYSDFPWERYPDRILPVITGRGCNWGVCSFCSDVTSSMGRTFRSRSPQNVLDELEYQARRHDASKFIFVDLKLNSNPKSARRILGIH